MIQWRMMDLMVRLIPRNSNHYYLNCRLHYKFLTCCFLLIFSCVACVSETVNEVSGDSAPKLLIGVSDKNSAGAAEDALLDISTTVPLVIEPEVFDNRDQFANGKKLSIPKVTGSVPPRDDTYHDTDNNAIVVLQSPTRAMIDFPRDRRKEVDWVKALDGGFIQPRADLKGESEMVTMDLNIIMKNTQFMPWVKFPHLAHTKWLACTNCHPKIFIPQEHANPISMNKVLRGEYCGVCHDKVSFSLFICERCHSVPHKGSGPAWWKK
jgi:c(7)-type cytochrome triheme protein